MHTKDARAEGETEQRLYALSRVARDAVLLRPRACRAGVDRDADADRSPTHVPDDVYDEMREHFDDEELAALTLAIVAINGWNRIAIAFRNEVGSYQPATAEVAAAAPASTR